MLGRRWWCFRLRAQPGVSCRRYRGRSNDPRSDCNHRRIASGSGPSTAGCLGVVPGVKPISKGPKLTLDQLNSPRPLTDLERKSSPELSIAETMAAPRAPDGHGGSSDHGGRCWRPSRDRRRIVGILCSVLLVVKLGGLLVQVFYFLRSLPLWRTLRIV